MKDLVITTVENNFSHIDMAEAFLKTFKRDYVSVNSAPNAETVNAQLAFRLEHYNNLHPTRP